MAIKAALTYEIREAAAALDKSPATIRNWIKDGLPVMAGQKPHLISGQALREYLRTKYQKSKSSLAPDEFHCFPCGKGQKPLDLKVDVTPNTPKTTRLKGVCSVCGASTGRVISNAKIHEFSETLRFKTSADSEA